MATPATEPPTAPAPPPSNPTPSSNLPFPHTASPYTKPFWRNEPNALDEYHSTPELPETCDVLIVGGGYAGITTAYHLVTDGEGFEGSVVLAEARQVCSGATGRNGGHLRPSWGEISKYVARHGLAAAAEVLNYEWKHLRDMRKLIRDENIDCEFFLSRCIVAYVDEENARKAKQVYDELMDLGLEAMEDVFYCEGKAAEGNSGVKGCKAMLSSTSGIIWPYKLMLHLLRQAVDKGVNLQTSTPVTKLSSTKDAEGYYAVETGRGTIRAKKVVNACNAYAAGVMPEYRESIIPCQGICCHITVPEGKTAPLLNNSYGVKMAGMEGSYLVQREDGSIIAGGCFEYRNHSLDWFDNTDDSSLIEVSKNFYDGYMQRTFRGWEESGAEVSQIWTGILGYSADTLPQIGAVPNKPDQYIIAGFNGHGMPVIFLSSKNLAEMIKKDISFEETEMPKLFETSQQRIEANRSKKFGGDILGY